jgi:hypothetical protein
VHESGASPYLCGAINGQYGYQLLEAFNFALEYVNNKTGMFKNKLRGVTIGGETATPSHTFM